MSYRPITDFWFLARCKYKGGVKRYGGYLGGFPERARILIGASLEEPVLHVCGGLAKIYPYERGIGKLDETQDLDESCNPDHALDASICIATSPKQDGHGMPWAGILIDPPYSEEDAMKYPPGAAKYPRPNELVVNALDALDVGRKVGIIHYIVPACPKNAKFVACVGIVCGFNNRIRAFSVFEKIAE